MLAVVFLVNNFFNDKESTDEDMIEEARWTDLADSEAKTSLNPYANDNSKVLGGEQLDPEMSIAEPAIEASSQSKKEIVKNKST